MNTTNMVQRGFEPVVAEAMRKYGDFDGVCLASIAVSLKRIADAASIRDELEEQKPFHELVVYERAIDARAAGFHSTGQHTLHRHIRAWWPDLGMRGLCAPPPFRVSIPRYMLTFKTAEGSLAEILRKRQSVYGADAVWIVT